jgi:hypothetical protein
MNFDKAEVISSRSLVEVEVFQMGIQQRICQINQQRALEGISAVSGPHSGGGGKWMRRHRGQKLPIVITETSRR